MKFWQLTSICRECPHALDSVLRKPEYADYLKLYGEIEESVRVQDREKLDKCVSDGLVREVLSVHTGRLYISGGYLRVRSVGEHDRVITVLDVFDRYGGDVLEDTMEYGLVKI